MSPETRKSTSEILHTTSKAMSKFWKEHAKDDLWKNKAEKKFEQDYPELSFYWKNEYHDNDKEYEVYLALYYARMFQAKEDKTPETHKNKEHRRQELETLLQIKIVDCPIAKQETIKKTYNMFNEILDVHMKAKELFPNYKK